MEDTNNPWNDEHDTTFIIELMIEAGYSISEIEKALGVNIRARMMMVEEVIQVLQSKICGELEVNCN